MATKLAARDEFEHVQAGSGEGGWSPAEPAGSRVLRRRRSRPHLLLGLLLVVVCAVGFLVLMLRAGERRAVLVLARPVMVGQSVVPADLRPVDIAADPDLPVLGADRAGAVVGRQLSTSLPAGALLSEGLLGPSMLPADGQAIVALTLKPGQLPVEVAAGAQVLVVLVPAQAGVAPGTGTGPGGPGSGGVGWAAVVTAVAPSSDSAVSVVSVQLPMESARRVAAVPAGQLSVVLVGRR